MVAPANINVETIVDELMGLLAGPPTETVQTTGINALLEATEPKWVAFPHPPDKQEPYQTWFVLNEIDYSDVAVSFGANTDRIKITGAIILQFQRRNVARTWKLMAKFLSPDAIPNLLTTTLPTSGVTCVCMSGRVAAPESVPEGTYARLEFDIMLEG